MYVLEQGQMLANAKSWALRFVLSILYDSFIEK